MSLVPALSKIRRFHPEGTAGFWPILGKPGFRTCQDIPQGVPAGAGEAFAVQVSSRSSKTRPVALLALMIGAPLCT